MMTSLNLPASVVMACHFTGIYDVNRNHVLNDDDFSLVKEWADSLRANKTVGILFHNNFSEITKATYENKWLHFVKVDYHPDFNPNVYRYCIYHQFIQAHLEQLTHFFLTDVSDVVMVNNPFEDRFFFEQPDLIFCGDEPTQLNNSWMQDHGTHFRSQVPDYEAVEAEHANSVLLNCGIVGGHINKMAGFVEALWQFHQTYNRNNRTSYTGDMGAFNYLLRKQYARAVYHGSPVNTIFKSYETERTDCWFRHK
jgi:hypothetical protein